MYTWEIEQIMQQNNYNIDSETYINICLSSPQINHVEYYSYENCFEININEENKNWKFKVHRKEN